MMLQEAERTQEPSADGHCPSISADGGEEDAPGHEVARRMHRFSLIEHSVPTTNQRDWNDAAPRNGTRAKHSKGRERPFDTTPSRARRERNTSKIWKWRALGDDFRTFLVTQAVSGVASVGSLARPNQLCGSGAMGSTATPFGAWFSARLPRLLCARRSAFIRCFSSLFISF